MPAKAAAEFGDVDLTSIHVVPATSASPTDAELMTPADWREFDAEIRAVISRFRARMNDRRDRAVAAGR